MCEKRSLKFSVSVSQQKKLKMSEEDENYEQDEYDQWFRGRFDDDDGFEDEEEEEEEVKDEKMEEEEKLVHDPEVRKNALLCSSDFELSVCKARD